MGCIILDISSDIGSLLARRADGSTDPLVCYRETTLYLNGSKSIDSIHLGRWCSKSEASLHRRILRYNGFSRSFIPLRKMVTTPRSIGEKHLTIPEDLDMVEHDIRIDWHSWINPTEYLRHSQTSPPP